MVKVLLTGGAGFIGSHLAEALLEYGHDVTFLDRLSTSGNLARIQRLFARFDAVRWVHHDLRGAIAPLLQKQLGEFDWILHLGASTHVDRSIDDPLAFVMDNVVGTCNILNFARATGCRCFLYFSTDEVFGPAPPDVMYKEWDRYKSGNPYAATKAGGEELALAFCNTYKLPIVITHTMNVFGRYQHVEKYIPNTIKKIRDGEMVTIHADSTKTKAGSRFYIHADDVARAVIYILKFGEIGEKYNIVGKREVDNLEVAQMIARLMDKELRYEMVDFHSSRPGHDLRYALDGGRMAAMGWRPKYTFEAGMRETVEWYLKNPEWL